MSQGVYQIPKVEFTSWSAATNTTPTAAYRGAGRPEAAAFLERIIDMAADELDIDPVEIRKQNFLAPDAFPLTTVTGANYDVGEYAKALDEACRIAGYDELRAEQARDAASAATCDSSGSASRPTWRSPRAGCSRSTAPSRSTRTAASPRPSARRRTARATRRRSR